MLLGLAAHSVVSLVTRDGSDPRAFLAEELSPWRLVANLAFLGEIWTRHVPFPWNGAI